jgi:FAD/FMN-containing dehydrogenase
MIISSRSLAQLVFRLGRQNHSVAPTLNAINEHDLAHFSKILPPSSILSTLPPFSVNPSELAPYNTDWMGKYRGHATTVLKPSTTQQVSDIMKHCWERRIGVVPQGGNTGLVGGSVPVNDELVLNLGNMSKVRDFNPLSGVVNPSPPDSPHN